MKITLTLDDDLHEELKQRAQELDKPFKQVVNEALRRGLNGLEEPPRKPVKLKTFSSGYQPGVDRTRLKQIDAEWELEEMIRKLNKR